jgi:hypothetical protein
VQVTLLRQRDPGHWPWCDAATALRYETVLPFCGGVLAAKAMQRARAGASGIHEDRSQHGSARARTPKSMADASDGDDMHVVAMPACCGDGNVPRCTYDAEAAAKLGHEIEVVRFATRVVDLTAAGTQVLSHGRVRERQAEAGRAAGSARKYPWAFDVRWTTSAVVQDS